MRIHFIAIGGAAMHNLALALSSKGDLVSGSDDEINEPSKSRLSKAGLLPEKMGWFPEKIESNLDAVILGMHARADNPELVRAQELKIPVYSYPEFLYEQSKNKQRVVVGGSHGKTSITAMILHVLNQVKYKFDFMVGSQLEGFTNMVKITSDAPTIILEGDEYLSSPIDRRPKFHLYKANIGLISGIAWDHINVFPTFDIYVEQFRLFINSFDKDGVLIYCIEDSEVKKLADEYKEKLKCLAYGLPEYSISDGITTIHVGGSNYALKVFGKHNLMNIEGAKLICGQLGVNETDFYTAIGSFKGAAKRLEFVKKTERFTLFKDFAHSPSKLKATVNAVKEQFYGKKIIACMELHTFSSLDANFLNQYSNCMDDASVGIVYYNPSTISHKRLAPISKAQIKEAFKNENIIVLDSSNELVDLLKQTEMKDDVLLMMSSGTFDGIDLNML